MKRLAVLSALLAASQSWAASPGAESLDARAVGMGGALRSLAETVSAARYNPAGLGPVRGFFGGLSYATQAPGAFDAFQVTLVDNITSPLGGAFQYVRLQGSEEREDVSLSLSAGGKGLWWGFTARYVHARTSDSSEWEQLFTGDLGFMVERPGGLRFAAVGYDLLDTTSEFLQRRLALAASKKWDQGWTIAADAVRDLDRDFSKGWELHLGGEYRRPASNWGLRCGQFWEGASGKDYASAGATWWPWGEIELAYAVRKARQNDDEYLHVFSLAGSF